LVSDTEGGTKAGDFENRVLRRVFGPKRGEVTGEWRRLRNEEHNDVYSSPNIIRLIKLRRMRWTGHVARMEERRGAYRILVGRLREGDHLGDPGVDGRVITNCIFNKWDRGAWTGLSWLRIGTGGGLL
jgi:hypothetical protein